MTELKGDIVVVADYNTLFSITDRTSTQKIKTEKEDLSNIINQLDLKDTYRHFIQQQQNRHSSQGHMGLFPGTGVRPQLSLSRFKR